MVVQVSSGVCRTGGRLRGQSKDFQEIAPTCTGKHSCHGEAFHRSNTQKLMGNRRLKAKDVGRTGAGWELAATTRKVRGYCLWFLRQASRRVGFPFLSGLCRATCKNYGLGRHIVGRAAVVGSQSGEHRGDSRSKSWESTSADCSPDLSEGLFNAGLSAGDVQGRARGSMLSTFLDPCRVHNHGAVGEY
jgi:hypothetical protein